MLRPDGQSCQSCAFFSEAVTEYLMSHCRRRAPLYFARRAITAFPQTGASDWCGQYNPQGALPHALPHQGVTTSVPSSDDPKTRAEAGLSGNLPENK